LIKRRLFPCVSPLFLIFYGKNVQNKDRKNRGGGWYQPAGKWSSPRLRNWKVGTRDCVNDPVSPLRGSDIRDGTRLRWRPSRDSESFLNQVPALTCWATIVSPFGLGRWRLGYDCFALQAGALAAGLRLFRPSGWGIGGWATIVSPFGLGRWRPRVFSSSPKAT